jgi:ABC-2 type transport system permease protein
MEKYIKFAVYLAAVILVNVAGASLYFRIDLTQNGLYTLSPASTRTLSSLSEPMTVHVFFTKNLPAPYNGTERYLHDLLEAYAAAGGKLFNYQFHDVTPQDGGGAATDEAVQLAQGYGIYPVQIQELDRDEVKFRKAYMGLVLIHGDSIERIPALTSTDRLEYRLTMAMEKLNRKVSALLKLPGKIKVDLYQSSSLDAVAPLLGLKALPGLPEKIAGMVKKLNVSNYGKLEFTRMDPSRDPSAEKTAQAHHLVTLQWPAIEKEHLSAGSGTIGLVLEYGKKSLEVPILNVLRIPIIGTRYQLADLSQLEEVIGGSVEKLVNINASLGYLADHGTLDLGGYGSQEGPDSMNNFSKLVSAGYSLQQVKLNDDALPVDLNCLVIARPTEKFSDYDLYRIDQALMRGTNLAIFLDRFHEMPQSQGFGSGAPPLDTGLEKLLAHYGVKIPESIVMDQDCYKQRMGQQFGGGERPIYFAPIIKDRFINHDVDFMKAIKTLIVFKASPVEVDPATLKDEGIKAIKLFSSSENAWEMKAPVNLNPMMMGSPPPKAQRKSLPLAYLLEGSFPSYFAGKPIPEKPEAKKADAAKNGAGKTAADKTETQAPAIAKVQGHGDFIAKSKPAKIFVVASSAMVTDNLLDAQGSSPNDTFVLNLIDNLNGRQDVASMRSKNQSFNPLVETEPWLHTAVKTFNVAGLPLLVVLFGLGVWTQRHRRRKRIQAMFQKAAKGEKS